MEDTGPTYKGPAVLITTADDDLAVAAALRVEPAGNLQRWVGQIACPGADFWTVTDEGGGVLRLPDGREGRFVPGPGGRPGLLPVIGSGPPPF